MSGLSGKYLPMRAQDWASLTDATACVPTNCEPTMELFTHDRSLTRTPAPCEFGNHQGDERVAIPHAQQKVKVHFRSQ
jgi:hypothetical protein